MGEIYIFDIQQQSALSSSAAAATTTTLANDRVDNHKSTEQYLCHVWIGHECDDVNSMEISN